MRDAAVRIAEQLPTEPAPDDLPAGAGGGPRAAALAGRRPLHLPRLPRVSAARRRLARRRRRHRPRHPAFRPAPRGRREPPGQPVLRAAARRRPAKAREHRLLVLTKANSRATVHRPSYLDYVGVRSSTSRATSSGSAASSASFSSAAYTESVRRVPVVRRKDGGGAGAGRLLAQQPRRAGSAADPGDVPARRDVPDAGRGAGADRHLRALPPGAAPSPALPAAGRVRALLLGPRLPPPRPLHHRCPAADHRDPQGGARRHQRRLHGLEHRVDPVPAALRGPCAAGHRAAAPVRRGQGAHRGPSRRGRPFLGRRVRRGADRRGRRGALARADALLRERLPRGLQGRPRPRPRSPTSVTWSGSTRTGRLR